MNNLKRYQKLVEEVELYKQQKDRAEGGLHKLLEDLKKYKVLTKKEGDILLEKEQQKKERMEKEFSKLLTEFEEEWEKQNGKTN